MHNNIILLDTETHALHGLVIQMAYANIEFSERENKLAQSQLQLPSSGSKTEPCLIPNTMFSEMYSIGDEKIDIGAMSAHNIIDSDLLGKPHCSTIELPFYTDGYIIGHNIDYDVKCLELSIQRSIELKRICTLAIARDIWPEIESHKLAALIYHIYGPTEHARGLVANSHDAAVDIRNTAHVLAAICAHLRITSIEQLYEVSQAARIPKIMPFGKHKGLPISKIPYSYMSWYMHSENPDPWICEAFKRHMNR